MTLSREIRSLLGSWPEGLSADLHELWHGIFPRAVGEEPLVGAVGVHHEDRRVRLKRIVVERSFVAPAVHAAVPEDVLAVSGPHRMTVDRTRTGQPAQIGAVGPDGEDVVVAVGLPAREHDAAAVGRPTGQIVGSVVSTRTERSSRLRMRRPYSFSPQTR